MPASTRDEVTYLDSATSHPIFLLPMKVETRFMPVGVSNALQLWLRIFPDQASLHSFFPELTSEEKGDLIFARQNYQLEGRMNEVGWKFLVDRHGAFRASWMIKAPDMPANEKDPEFYFKWLPNYFVAYLYPKGREKPIVHKLREIDKDGLVMLEESPDEEGWLTDLDIAIGKGMAAKIPIEKIEAFDKIIVVGYRRETPSSAPLQEWISNHLFTEGLSFLDYGTPTNNLKEAKSGYSIRDEFDVEDTYLHAVLGQQLQEEDYGSRLAKGLGCNSERSDRSFIKHIPNARNKESILSHLIQKSTWFSLGGKMLQMLLGENIDAATHAEIWKFYSAYVKNRGPYPAIKIADQPYGLLPVTLFNQEGETNHLQHPPKLGRLEHSLRKLFEKWLKIARGERVPSDDNSSQYFVPRVNEDGSGSNEIFELLKMQPSSTQFQWRAMGLERIKGLIPGWLPAKVGYDDSTAFFSLPPMQIHALLNGVSGYHRDMSHSENAFSKLETIGVLDESSKKRLKNAPVLCFKNAESIAAENVDISLLPDRDAWIGFRLLLNNIDHEVNSPISLKGTPSVLMAWLLDSLSRAAALFGGASESYKVIKKTMVEICDELGIPEDAGDDTWSLDKAHANVLEEAIAGVLDLNSFRLDAWLSGLAKYQLDQLRKEEDEGIYFGAYGWVENLRKTTSEAEQGDGGIIHCPTLDQAVTAAMFRTSFSEYKDQKANPFSLNLTSDRVQKGKQFLEGIREGQELEALLGYQIERFLHENKQGDWVSTLRKKHPLLVNKPESSSIDESGLPNLTVIDGLKLMQDTEYWSEIPLLKKGVKLLQDMVDASNDLLFYEAGYQMIKGNYSQAAAVMDAAKGILDPPKLEALDTQIPGNKQRHQLVMLFQTDTENTPSVDTNPKGSLEPVLENWLAEIVGDLAKIGVSVELWDQQTLKGRTNIHLDLLGIGYLDLFYLCEVSIPRANWPSEREMKEREKVRSGATKLEQLIIQYIPSFAEAFTHKINDPSDDLISLFDVIPVMDTIRGLLSKSRSLRTGDLLQQGEGELFSSDFINRLAKKINDCFQQLASDTTKLSVLSKYDVPIPLSRLSGTSIIGELEQEDKKRIEKKVKLASAYLAHAQKGEQSRVEQFEGLEKAAKVLFGKSFRLLHPFTPPPNFIMDASQKKLCGHTDLYFPNGVTGGVERIRHWIDGRAAVKDTTEAFSDFLMATSIWDLKTDGGFEDSWSLKIAQSPINMPWIALDKQERSEILKDEQIYPAFGAEERLVKINYPEDGQATVVYLPQDYQFSTEEIGGETSLHFGVLIDQFVEFIPTQEVETGVAFEADAPNNEAPQALLLAAPPKGAKRWTDDLLKDILVDTLDLLKVRMVDMDALLQESIEHKEDAEYNGLPIPMSYWFHIPTQF